MRILSVIVLITSVILSAACGFHLRGSGAVAERFYPLFVETGDLQSTQVSALTNALKQSNAQLSTLKDCANRLKLKLIPLKPQKIASSSLTDIEIVRLSMQADFSVISPGAVVLIEDKITHSRELELDKANVLSHQSLIEQSYRELERSLIRSLLYRLKR